MKKYLIAALILNCVVLVAIFKVKTEATAKIEGPLATRPEEGSPPVLSLPEVQPAPKPKVIEPKWTHWPVQRKWNSGSGYFADFLNHSKGAPFTQGDRVTQAHETVHGINSEIRNSLLMGKKGNGYYVGKDRAVLITEPKCKLSDLIPFIPEKLRGNRFKLYLRDQQRDWNNMPTYIFDEGIAYLDGGRVGVEEAKKNEKDGKTDILYSCAEFPVYATAFMMAVEKHDPDYFKNNEQTRSFFCWYLKESFELYRKSQEYHQFQWDPKYYENVKTGDAGKPLRDFWQNKLGLDLKVILGD